jgi:hypothetical protein
MLSLNLNFKIEKMGPHTAFVLLTAVTPRGDTDHVQ